MLILTFWDYALRPPLWAGNWIQEHRKVCKCRIRVGIIITRNRKSAFSKVLKLCFTSKPDRAYALRSLMDRKMNPNAPEGMQISNPHGHHIYKKSENAFSKVLKLCFTSKPDRAYALRPLTDRKWFQEHLKVCKSRIPMGIIFVRNRKSVFSKVLKLWFTLLMLILTI